MSDSIPAVQSKAFEHAPRLTSRGLTIMLVAMCLAPVATITALFWYMPPVYEGELEASVTAEDLPAASFYDTYYGDREPVGVGVLVIHNDSEQDWTNLNILINGNYQIHEHNPIPAGESRRFRTDRFVSRTGARFDLRYNPLKHIRIYARRPTRDRATFATDFAWDQVE